MSWFSAPLPSQRWAYALSALVASSAAPVLAQVPPTTQVPPASQVPPADRSPAKDAPVTAQAEEITGRPDRELNLIGNAELTRAETRMKADTVCFRQVEDEVTATGNVQMWRFGDEYKGDELKVNLSSGQGYLLRPEYRLQLNNAQGNATRLDFLSEQEAMIINGTYSTCEGPDPDWYLRASTLRLDQGRDVGVAGRTVVYFKGVPIVGAPALSFSLSGARRSGWLPPTVGFGSKGRAEVMVPYYFNIAPNRDLTVFPRLMLERGIQLGATGRYLGETSRGGYQGETHLEFLLKDRKTKTNRWYADSKHSQSLAPNWSYGWNVRGASDDEYFSDFSRSVNVSAERQLLRELRTDYYGKYWSLSARAQGYQILQDPAAKDNPSLAVARPYDRLPEVLFRAARYDVGGFDWSVDGQVTRFSHPELASGNRAVAVGQVSYPFVRPGYFVTPKVQLHASSYQIERDGPANVASVERSISRTLPTFSVDSGMVFERAARLLGRSMTQTLEPRLFYVYTPYKDQSAIPNFDTAEASFNFAQLFNENRFVGSDRVADANQVTTALVSRFLEANGAERLRLAVGQRFHFTDQRVQLNGNAANPNQGHNRSDLLLAAAGRVSETWSFDSAIDYNADTKQTMTANFGTQWMPAPLKVINVEYRFLRDTFKNFDISSQWPISNRWFGVGRVSYSLRDRKVLESLIGLEYKADCWVFRIGAQRFVTTAQNVSTPFFFQLELNGLSKLGTGSPLESFYRSIPGYARVNQSSSTR